MVFCFVGGLVLSWGVVGEVGGGPTYAMPGGGELVVVVVVVVLEHEVF